MKNLFTTTILVSAMALVGCQTTTTTVASAQKNYNVWDSSCNSHYKKLSSNTFKFVLEKGQIGGCPTDRLPTPQGDADFSERAEVNSDNVRLPNGKYIWSATIDIDRPCKPAKRNEIFQIHEGGSTVNAPPSQLGIEHWNTFKTNQHFNTAKKVPDRPFDVIADIIIKRDSVKVTYFIDGEEWKTTWAPRENTGKVYVKFGTYRINSNCTYKSTYTNVNFKRVK